ncbi:MAG: hypothetical protein EOP49_01985 [Sphingobacteriales bacterium]|nr:MAG: hypothetical protein EOP49_01985 [Sphingobacteriales bacterium]
MISTKHFSHFKFEEDFMEDGIRCIPMIVRFKLDLAGIKLKLAEWCRFSVDERATLTGLPCRNRFRKSGKASCGLQEGPPDVRKCFGHPVERVAGVPEVLPAACRKGRRSSGRGSCSLQEPPSRVNVSFYRL